MREVLKGHATEQSVHQSNQRNTRFRLNVCLFRFVSLVKARNLEVKVSVLSIGLSIVIYFFQNVHEIAG